jgi:hypothetical protein
MADIISAASFLGSEVGLVVKTASTYVDDEALGNKGVVDGTIKAGTIYAGTNVKGLVFTDVDISGSSATKQVAIPVMVAGRFVNHASVLPKVLGTDTKLTLANAQAQGLFPETSGVGAVERPY